MFDVIVVGARCAGSSVARLLARQDAKVLLVDRAPILNDPLNGHYIHAAGTRALARWGLIDRLVSPASQPTRSVRIDVGPLLLQGTPTWSDGQPAFALAPRRHRLDTLLMEAAAEAGAEVRLGFSVDDVVWDGDRMVGIVGHGAGGTRVEERAQIVVGADGMTSKIAAAVAPAEYETQPTQTCWYYSHWADLPTNALELYYRTGRAVLVFPSDDGLTCVAIAWHVSEFARVRADIEAAFSEELQRLPGLDARVRAGRRVEPFRGTANLPTYLRVPYGPGWALVGDAACRVDPITGQGITDAFRDAEFLSEAIDAGVRGERPFDDCLAEYQRRRDAAVLPVYRLTAQRARLEPASEQVQRLFGALRGNQSEIDRYVGVTAGTVAYDDFFSPESLGRIIGPAAQAAA